MIAQDGIPSTEQQSAAFAYLPFVQAGIIAMLGAWFVVFLVLELVDKYRTARRMVRALQARVRNRTASWRSGLGLSNSQRAISLRTMTDVQVRLDTSEAEGAGSRAKDSTSRGRDGGGKRSGRPADSKSDGQPQVNPLVVSAVPRRNVV